MSVQNQLKKIPPRLVLPKFRTVSDFLDGCVKANWKYVLVLTCDFPMLKSRWTGCISMRGTIVYVAISTKRAEGKLQRLLPAAVGKALAEWKLARASGVGKLVMTIPHDRVAILWKEPGAECGRNGIIEETLHVSSIFFYLKCMRIFKLGRRL